VKEFVEKHWQTGLNLFLAGVFLHYGLTKRPQLGSGAGASFVEIAFYLHNIVFIGVVLFRQQHRSVEMRVIPQIVALTAFFSGMWFVQTPDASPERLLGADIVTLLALLFGMGCLLNLGRSFGILIAIRTVRTTGIYGMIRHPMYLSDIVWRVGYLLKNSCTQNLVIFVLSGACYVIRAIMEENFLSQFPEYQEYKTRVRYRFIPGVF